MPANDGQHVVEIVRMPQMVRQCSVILVGIAAVDLKAVAGTGQMVGFGSSWVGTGTGAATEPYRVHPASEPAAAPNQYVLNAGVVKLSSSGSYEEILNQLRAARDR